jgi:hypothetical protein
MNVRDKTWMRRRPRLFTEEGATWLAVLFAMGIVLLLVSMTPARCQAGWCPSYKCFGPCGGTCRCVSKDFSGGTCLDIERAEQLLAEGWVEIK